MEEVPYRSADPEGLEVEEIEEEFALAQEVEDERIKEEHDKWCQETHGEDGCGCDSIYCNYCFEIFKAGWNAREE